MLDVFWILFSFFLVSVFAVVFVVIVCVLVLVLSWFFCLFRELFLFFLVCVGLLLSLLSCAWMFGFHLFGRLSDSMLLEIG